jgi:hypothetical protein
MERVKSGFTPGASRFFGVIFGTVLPLVILAAASAQTTNLAVTVRHAPNLNGNGLIEGSLQQLLGESTTLNGGFTMTGDLFAPGTPSVRINGNPAFGGTIAGGGSASPTGYQVTLNGNCSLRYLRTRIAPVTLPTVAAPPSSAGTRTVTINSAGQSIGDPATLRNLTLNGNVGQVAVPPGTYGTFAANGGSGFGFGVAGASTPVVYNLQNLNLNGQCRLDIVGPVILTVANGFAANGRVGTTNHSSWLQFQVASGGFTLNGGCTVHGGVTAPAGTVIVNGNSLLVGSVQCDRLTVNGGGCIKAGGTGGAANQPPVADGQQLTTAEDTPLIITLTGSDPEGASLTYLLLSRPAHGVLNPQPSTPNQYIYVPNANFNGSDSFTFKVNDGQADSAAAVVAITVTPVNDAPVALGQNLSTPEDTPVTVELAGTDVDNDPLTFEIVKPPARGILNLQPATLNQFTYTPFANTNGLDSFQFSVSDGQLRSTNTIHIAIQPVEDAPVAGSQTVATDEDTPVPVALTALDVEGDGLTFTNLTQPAHGVLSGSPPDLIYTPATNYNGKDSFQFMACDAWLDSAPATISLIIRPVNDAPVARPQVVVTAEDTATNLTLAAEDVEGDSLSFNLLTAPASGTLAGVAPSLVFSPAANLNGTNTFEFVVSDGQSTSAPAVVTLIVTPVNDQPVAAAQAMTLDEDTPATVTLHGNDADGDTLTFFIVTPPTNGTLAGTAPDLVYTPAENFSGADSFTFEASDGQTNSLPAMVTLTVWSVNDPPVADDQSVVTDEGTSLATTLTGSDVENDSLTFAVVEPPVHGELSGTAPDLVYTPAPNYSGPDAFAFKANDGQADSAAAQVSITVRQINRAPVVEAGPDRTNDFPGPVQLTGTACDDGLPVGGALSVTWSLVSGLGEVSFDDPHATNAIATFTGPGEYVLRLSANDTLATNSDEVAISVVAPESGDFQVEAGSDQLISLPNAVSLAGAVEIQSPQAGGSTNVSWSKLDGPDGAQFSDPNALCTAVQFSQPGSYTLKLQVAYGGGTRSDRLNVDVLPAPPDRLTAARSSQGTDFWLTFLNNEMPYYEIAYYNHELIIAADEDTTGYVGGNRFQVRAGSTTTVSFDPCGESLSVSDLIQSNAVHVVADHPVTVYGLDYEEYTTDGYLALPTAMLGTDYLILSYQNSVSWYDPEHVIGGTQFAVVASEDATTVTVTPSVAVDSRLAGVPYPVVLQKGETYRLINNDGPDADFTGTTVTADKPIAVFAGHMCALVPPGVAAADHLVEQLPPVNTWGRHFVTLPLAGRIGGDTFRILAATNGTGVAINGKIAATLDRGQFLEQLIDCPAEILASKPVLVAQYANGTEFDDAPGDPFMMLIPPFEQCGGDYILSTSLITNFWADPTKEVYTSYLNLTVRANGAGEILLDDTPVPASCFQSIGDSGYAGAQLPINPGVHHLSAPVPFGACVYGWADSESYAFVGGIYSETIESGTRLELTQSTPFAAVGQEKTLIVRVTNGRGRPVPDLEVSFSVSGANAVTGHATTSHFGEALFSYIGANAGEDVVTATLTELEQSVTNTWMAGSDNAPPGVSTADTPPTQFSRTVELRGTISDDGRPAGNLHVQWRVIGGLGMVQIEAVTQTVTRAYCSRSGSYEFELSADDTQFSSRSRVKVMVDDPPGIGFPLGYIDIPSLVPVGASIPLMADAWDDDGEIDRIEFYANGNLIGTATSWDYWTGYSISWTPGASGQISLHAVAFDNLGGSNSLDLGTIQASCPPRILIDSPVGGTVVTVPTNVLVHAVASDLDGTITSVSIYANGELVGTADGPDASATWFPRREGDYILTAVAMDDAGLSTASEGVLVTVGGDFPSITLLNNATNRFGNPYFEAPIGVPTLLAADVRLSGPYHITNVTFSVAGLWGGVSGTNVSLLEPPWQFLWMIQDRDSFFITIVAEADSGAVGEISKSVYSSRKVSIAFAAPDASRPVVVGAPVAIRLAVDDPGQILVTFDYYVDGQLLIETNNSDAISWQPPAPGNYQLTARALDRIWGAGVPIYAGTLTLKAYFAFFADCVAIVSPEDEASLYVGSPTFVCLAFDDPTGGFDHAQIFTNGVSLGQTTNSWLEWVPGQTNDYSLTAVAYDHQGNASAPSEPVLVHVLAPPPPEIVILSPNPGDRLALGQEMLVEVDVNDPAQAVTNLELFVDGIKVTDSFDSFIPWTPDLTGNHTLTVIAADWNSDRVASAPVNAMVVEMHPPMVTIAAPSDGFHYTVETLPPLTATASDPDGTVTNLVLEWDGTVLEATNGATLEFSATNISGGWHTVLARATDNDGLTTVSTNVSFFIERGQDGNLQVPQQFAAEALSAAEIRLSWAPLPTNSAVASVLVERWDNTLSAWLEIGSAAITATNYTDSSLNPETCHRYRVATTDNVVHRSAYSVEVQATTRTVVPGYSAIDLTEALIASLTGHGAGANILTNSGLHHFDSRRIVPPGAVHAETVLGTNAAALKLAVARFKERWPQIQLDYDPILLSPKSVLPRVGYLTGPGGAGVTVSEATAQLFDPANPDRPVKAFLQEYQALFGFGAEALDDASVQRDYVSAGNGARTVVWQQQVAGVPVFNALLVSHITQDGELACLSSEFIPSPAHTADPAMLAAVQSGDALPLSSPQALAAAVTNVGERFAGALVMVETDPEGVVRRQTFTADTGIKGEAQAELTWFPAGRAQLKLCWQVLFTSRWLDEMYLTLVTADTGEIVYRRNLTAESSPATYRVYTGASPAPLLPGLPAPDVTQPATGERNLVTFTSADDIASPNGWIADGDNETRGNNVDAHLDRNDDNVADLPRPTGNPSRVFDFPLDLTTGPANYGEAATVQLFYWNNWMHDVLYEFGFTEAAGNFQTDDFGRAGFGNDAVQADAQDGLGLSDGHHANNANMSTPPDGFAPRMQMYLFNGATPGRDGSLDAQIVLHEYTHGLSSRLVGGGAGIDAIQTAGLGEGWSDFFALALLADPVADVDGAYPMASYATYHGFGTLFEENYYYGIRRYPYCTDTNKNPLTFADIDPAKASPHTGVPRNPLLGPFRADQAGEVHAQGEVWCMMLWEMRANLIRKLGPDAGYVLALQLVTDGLKLSPPNPNFVQARDAILLADRMMSGGANATEIWSAFAKRGLGFNAKAPESYTTTGAQESRDLMPALAAERVEIQNTGGAIELGVNNNLLVHLRNRGDAAATHVSGQLAATTAGVGALQNLSTYPDIPQNESRANVTMFRIQTGTSFAEGTPIDLAFVINSDQNAGTNYLRLFTGVPGAEILFDNYSVLADVGSDSRVTKDLTPLDLGKLEPLWMDDNANCLLKLDTGKYFLWRLNGDPIPMQNTNFVAHRLTHNGVVVGELILTNTPEVWVWDRVTIDRSGQMVTNHICITNRLPHTCGAKWIPGESGPVPLTLTGNDYRFPKNCLLYTNVGSVYDPASQSFTWLGFATNYPTLHSAWDLNTNGQAVGAVSVYVQPTDANHDDVISRFELEFSLTEMHEFTADGSLNWVTNTERGVSAGYNGAAEMQIYYNAMLNSAVEFDLTDWRWLGPLNIDWGASLYSTALLVNDAGMVAGYGGVQVGNATFDALQPTHAFRAPQSGEFTGNGILLTNDLGVLPGGLHSFPRAMNQAGDVVGYSDFDFLVTGGLTLDSYNSHAVYWSLTNATPEYLTNLPPSARAPFGFGDAYAINNSNQIVGASMTANSRLVAALWQLNHNTNGVASTNGVTTTNAPFWEITDLNNRLADTNWNVFRAVGINDDNLILAHAIKTSGEKHAVLLVPMALAVDANRDGQTTFDEADSTTQAKPYRFWLNDDQDESRPNSLFTEDDPEIYEDKPTHHDSDDRVINNPRDCEDLTRLWLDTGDLSVSLAKDSGDLYVGLKWEKTGGTKPSIRLFRSMDANGGLGHIKNAMTAAFQASGFPDSIDGPNHCLLDTTAPDSIPLPADTIDQVQSTDRPADFIFKKSVFTDPNNVFGPKLKRLFLLFEGVREGKGELRLVFLKKNSDGSWTSLGEGPGVWLDLKNIRRMYVRVHSTPLPEKFPLPWQDIVCQNPPPFPYLTNWMSGSLYIPENNIGYDMGDSVENTNANQFDASPDEQKKCLVFVHGIDLPVAEQQGYAQSFYKRLWWEGFRGRFVAFRWATTLDQGMLGVGKDRENTSLFNSGEYRSWYGGASLLNYVTDLHTQLGDDWIVSVAAHSLGNACTGEALRQGMQVNSYVAMEAAVPLSCYYSESESPPTDSGLVRADNAKPTPQFASELGCHGYLSEIGNNHAINRASYYNANDFWLVTGYLGGILSWKSANWMANQIDYKPDDRYGPGQYEYDSQAGLPRQARFMRGKDYTRSVSDQFEAMAFVARSRTRPLGAGEPPSGKFLGLNLREDYKFDRERSCHSGQFQRNIQLMYGDADGTAWPEPFYHRVMNDLRVSP